MIKKDTNTSAKENPLFPLATLIDQLRLSALEIESFGFPNLTKATQISTGAHNSIFTVKEETHLLLREENKLTSAPAARANQLRTMAFLRSLPSQSFLALPQLVSIQDKITSIEKKADTDLNRYLREIVSIDQVQNIVAQIVLGLETLHQQQIAHRDLKPENILLSRSQENEGTSASALNTVYEVKIADLDLIFDSVEATRGTKAYSSPTLIYIDTTNKTLARSAQDRLKDDIWALGVTITDLVVKKRQPHTIRRLVNSVLFELGMIAPTAGADPDKLQRQKRAWQAKLRTYLAEQLKPALAEQDELKDFILFLLEFEEDKRPTIQQIKNSTFLTHAIANASSARSTETDLTGTPFWLLAEKIRNFAKNLETIDQNSLTVDDIIRFGLSNQVRNFLALIEDLPLKNQQLHASLSNLLNILASSTLQSYLLDDIQALNEHIVLVLNLANKVHPHTVFFNENPGAAQQFVTVHSPPRPSRRG